MVVPGGAVGDVASVVVTVAAQASNVASFRVTGPPPVITSATPLSGTAGTAVTITGVNLGTNLLLGKVGWWGPFASGVAPNNLIAGRPNGTFVGTPTFTGAGGGGFVSSDANYLAIADGGTGGAYDWAAGPWSTQVDFTFPVTPVWPANGSFVLASKGSYANGTGWEILINNVAYQDKYQIMFVSNHGDGTSSLITAYLIVPGAQHRALFVCDGVGTGTWYVDGAAWGSQACTAPASASTDLLIGRYSDGTGFAANFPISRVQIWNRALSPGEAAQTTTADPAVDSSVVTFNGAVATPTSWTPTSIVALVPPTATSGDIVATVDGQPSNGVAFAVSPSITSLSRSSGPVGASVSIAGANFGAAVGTSTVTFNGTVGIPTTWSATNIVVPVPAGATNGNVVVTVAGRASNGAAFIVTGPPPIITSVSPLSGNLGTVVTLTGSNFGASAGTSTVAFNGALATPTTWTATSIVVPVPVGATTGGVVVTVAAQASNSLPFTVVAPPPTITSLLPLAGPIGLAITVSGNGFGAIQGTSTIKFNGTVATPTSWSPSSIVVPVPIGATTGPVVVTVSGQASNGVVFNLTGPLPTITNLAPASGIVGTAVAIEGINFGSNLVAGKIGWWGPFASGASQTNLMAGRPNGTFVGTPTFTTDGGGAIVSSEANYLAIADGGAGGAYDWTAGAWSTQVDFTFPATPVWPANGSFVLASKGSYANGNGWEILINNVAFQGKYQIMFVSNHGAGSSSLITAYLIAPGALHRALFVCDSGGAGTWYVNGAAWGAQPCAVPASASTDLVIGRYSDGTGFASNFPISRVQIWNRALSAEEATSRTTADPTLSSSTVTFNGAVATATSWTPTSIVALVPSGATSGDAIVTVGGLAVSNRVNFTVIAAPSITSLSPPSGVAGTAVSIGGANFGSVQGSRYGDVQRDTGHADDVERHEHCGAGAGRCCHWDRCRDGWWPGK